METKLIKLGESKYTLIYKEGNIVVEHDPELDGKLSLKNCQAIENGYDLDEIRKLADKDFECELGDGPTNNESINSMLKKSNANGAEWGFQKALSILGDKKFSVGDIQNFIDNENPGQYPYIALQLKQKSNEFDVEIEMEYQGFEEDGKLKEAYLPKLDVDGCLVLRRK